MAILQKVLSERERQKTVEGWTPEHDDQHSNRELALAACYYAMPEVVFLDKKEQINHHDIMSIQRAMGMLDEQGRMLPEYKERR